MSSVLHPVGPEPEQTYWVRRILVLAAAVLVVALLIAFAVGGTSSGSAVSADPSPTAASEPPPYTPSPTPLGTPTPSASPSPSGSPSASSSAASPSPSGSVETGASASPSPSTTPTAKASTTPKAKAKPVLTTCDPDDLRATLTGKQKLKPEQATTFDLSLINGSGTTCFVTVDQKSFELKIYSGTDRIWSSNDCSKAVKAVTRKVKAEEAVTWSMRWDGRRSRKDCKSRPEIPQPGTYFATAQLDGAKPVQLRMILRG
jgi:hypothetical protein